jgi:hypothetical protein
LFAGKKVQDEALFLRGATKVADGMADIMNAFGAEHVNADES